MTRTNDSEGSLHVNIKTAAKLLGVSKRTVRDMTKSGRLPSIRIGRRVLYSREALEKFVREHSTFSKQRDLSQKLLLFNMGSVCPKKGALVRNRFVRTKSQMLLLNNLIKKEKGKIMTTIITDGNGTRRLTFIDKNEKRHYVRLGKIDAKMAATIKTYVEKLVVAQKLCVSPDAEATRWIADLPDEFHAKLAKTKLIPERKKAGTLGELIPSIIASRVATVNRQTIETMRQSEECLYRCFGKDRKVDTITRNDAESFRSWLLSSAQLDGKAGLHPAIVWKRLQHVVRFFENMVQDDEITKNPFEGLTMSPVVNEERNHYIDEKTIYQVMEVLPDAEWKLLLALWRFGGLRASEPFLLRWEDILWDQEKIIIHSPKRYEEKLDRTIPIFPEILKPLQEVHEQAAEGDVYIIAKHVPRYLKTVLDRSKIARINSNFGSVLGDYVKKAGFEPWDKILINLRASAKTDLLNGKYGRFDIQTIAEWLGGSPKAHSNPLSGD